jgi:uncharacterized protein (DUF1697 family)
MPRYVAFLRGVSPMNAKMPELKRCFEGAGFTDVKTVLASGNVVFNARAATEEVLARKAEAAMTTGLNRCFMTIVRSTVALQALLDNDPYGSFRLTPKDKCIVTFLRKPQRGRLSLPIEQDGARILAVTGNEAFSVYAPTPRGPVFMTLLEKTFGKDVTTRTWDTVRKCVSA